MEVAQATHEGINFIIELANGKLIPIMLIAFSCAIILRLVLFYTIRREQWMIEEFEKRVEKDLKSNIPVTSFQTYTKKTWERTFQEIFTLRSTMKRRKPDMIMSLSDRLFLVEKGASKFIEDINNRLEFFKPGDDEYLRETTVNSFERNDSFSKSFGLISNTWINNMLSIMPSIFIICGIFGTFIGIMAALPGLAGMDFSDPKIATAAMDQFLHRITFSMTTSVVGIILSIVMSVLNTSFQVESMYVKAVDKCVSTLKLISAAVQKNESEIPSFDTPDNNEDKKLNVA